MSTPAEASEMEQPRMLPDLAESIAQEAHVGLFFDDRSGVAWLAVGAKRSLTIGVEHEDMIEAWEQFGRGTWTYGWLGYEAKNVIEKLHSGRNDPQGAPVLHWVEPRILISWNPEQRGKGSGDKPYIETGHDEADAEAWLKAASRPLRADVEPESAGISLAPHWDKATYLQRVARVKQHIQRGDVYELNLCQAFEGRGKLASPYESFVRLHRRTRAPFSTYIRAGEHHLMCGSPERFLQRTGTTVISQPIKGTVARGSGDDDAALAQALAADPKERAENIMICDLVRNDLSRVAAPGTVEVPELCGIHTFETVHQMISTVRCELAEGKTNADLFRATFPMGSMTGAPKIRAMELIDDFEAVKRGLYSGTAGFVHPSGDLDLNVVIRSAMYNERSERVSVHVGGAITALSEAERELEECVLKAKAVLAALGANSGQDAA